MMKKKIRLTETELVSLIERIIKEEQLYKIVTQGGREILNLNKVEAEKINDMFDGEIVPMEKTIDR